VTCACVMEPGPQDQGGVLGLPPTARRTPQLASAASASRVAGGGVLGLPATALRTDPSASAASAARVAGRGRHTAIGAHRQVTRHTTNGNGTKIKRDTTTRKRRKDKTIACH
jgi:hypothetical protein